MTIDEAIAHSRAISKYKRKKIDKCINKNIYACKFCNEIRTCKEVAEEHEQLAEWLEELKVYQQHEIICNKGYNAGYNKAINDFIEKVELKYLGVHPDDLYDRYYPREICNQINEIAKQLKVGGKNE